MVSRATDLYLERDGFCEHVLRGKDPFVCPVHDACLVDGIEMVLGLLDFAELA